MLTDRLLFTQVRYTTFGRAISSLDTLDKRLVVLCTVLHLKFFDKRVHSLRPKQ